MVETEEEAEKDAAGHFRPLRHVLLLVVEELIGSVLEISVMRRFLIPPGNAHTFRKWHRC